MQRRWGEAEMPAYQFQTLARKAATDRVELPYTTKGRLCKTCSKMAQRSLRYPQFSSGRILEPGPSHLPSPA